jgi:hypothetical protein
MEKCLPNLPTDYTGDYPDDKPDGNSKNGWTPPSPPAKQPCPDCDSSGVQGPAESTYTCPACNGSGFIS